MPAVKLAVTADLHVPITSLATIAHLTSEVAAFAPDAFVVAGDVAESLTDTETCLKQLRQTLRCPVWVLPGNHDLWARGLSSKYLWEVRLQQEVESTGCHWLEGTAFVIHGVGVAGTIAWYDYSAADPSVKATAEAFASEKRWFNMDAVAINWEWSDPQFADLVAGPFLAALDGLEADAAVRQTVVVTHVPLLECQMCRDSGNPDWAFSNAYFGNLTLGEKMLARRKVTHVLSGHTHIERGGRVVREDGSAVEARVLGSHYGKPVWLGLTLGGDGK